MATINIVKNRQGKPTYYRLQWTENGKREHVTLGAVGVVSQKQVNDILKAKELELSTGARILGIGPSRTPNFGQYANDYILWHQSEYPNSHYRVAQIIRQHLMPIYEFVDIGNIDTSSAEQYKQDRRRQGAKAHTITKEIRTFKAILNKAVRDKVIAENPIEYIKAPKILDSKPHLFYEVDQLQRLYSACSNVVNNGLGPQPNPLHASMWKLLVNTGMRRGEAMQFRKKWIGSEGLKIVSTGEERTKSGSWREIPKTAGAAEALDRLKHEVSGEYVLPRITLPSVSRSFARDAHRAGIPGSLHTLRHTYISLLIRDTAIPMRTVQLWAGHSSITVTEQYSYLRDSTKVSARDINL